MRESILKAGHLQSKINSLWTEACSGNQSIDKLTAGSSEFQSALYDFRSREIPVFDYFYWKFRNDNEVGMKSTAKFIVKDFKGPEEVLT